jgi:hypothetical protein
MIHEKNLMQKSSDTVPYFEECACSPESWLEENFAKKLGGYSNRNLETGQFREYSALFFPSIFHANQGHQVFKSDCITTLRP